jgi:predicted nucleic acid-binding Zn ribbon protein
MVDHSDSSSTSGGASGGSGKSGGSGTSGAGKSRASAQLTTAADVLQALLQNSKSQLSDGFLRWRLEQQWVEVVGSTIGDQTCPAAFDRGTLYIWVRHSAWMQQLWFFQEPIREKVNNHLGREWVKQVRFTLSRRAATSEPTGSAY